MLKKFTKFFVIVLLIMFLIPSAVSAFACVMNNTYTYANGYTEGFFCMNHGLGLFYGLKFKVYEVGSIAELKNSLVASHLDHAGLDNAGDDGQLLSFIVGDLSRQGKNDPDLISNTSNSQIWRNWIWYLLDERQYAGIDPNSFATLEEKYFKYIDIYNRVLKVTDPSSEVTITASNPDVVVPDSNGIIGPFTITYPYDILVDELIKVVISVDTTSGNNVLFDAENSINKLQKADGTPFQIGDTEFYLKVEEVDYGAYNTFKIDWEFEYYAQGQYAKLMPQRQLYIEIECKDCGAIKRLTNTGYFRPNSSGSQLELEGNWKPVADDDEISSHGLPDIAPYNYSNYTLQGLEDGYYIEGESHYTFYGTSLNNYKHYHLVEDPDTGESLGLSPYPTTVSHIKYLTSVPKEDNDKQEGLYDPNNNYGLQNFIYLYSTPTSIKLQAEIQVLIGQPNIKISLDKVDAILKTQLSGVEFQVTVENGAVVVGNTVSNPFNFTTNGTTQEIEIKPDNSNGLVNQIVVRLTEVSPSDPDGYLQYLSDIVMTFTWNMQSSQWELTNLEVPDFETVTQTLGTNQNEWTINAENRPKIELSGVVWIDEPTGEKKIDPPDGYYNGNESPKAGVEVYLYKSDGTWVREDGYGNMYGTDGYLVTDANGAYKFENLPKLPNGQSYYIVFRYDGINYIRTVNGQSKATESDRAAFNNRFKTISAGQSNDGTQLSYNYDGNSISTLITEDGNGKVLDEFAVKANTTTYNDTTTDIDLGLRAKVLDLSLMTDLYKASATINGVPVEYTYNDVFDTSGTINTIIDISQNVTSGTKNYSMDLYKSDYTYRIGDYLGGSPSLSHQPSLDAEEQTALQDSREELQVILEYVLLLNNQSVTEAEVEQVVYYYDSNLTPTGITGGQATNASGRLIIVPDTTTLGYGEQTRITIQFSYKVENTESQPTIRNYAEILQYSTTEGGYVDCDSAPGNAFEGGSFKYEDDADAANGLKINIASSEREISGYVYEDNKTSVDDNSGYTTGNGKYDAGETRVDDVIVQLVEVKNLVIGGTTHRLEYIWQETTTGSNVVRAISADGTSIGTYTVPAETGKYTFRGFIPGDYIVRFIYGDGTYYDSAINSDNILKYNGQDYKSTVDKLYTVSWLTLGSSGYSEHDSMARDIESRRLEVMKYALETDPSNLIINSKEKLENTWMAADTSKIGVPDSMVVQSSSAFIRQGIDFGLVKRPETTVELVKHITSVRLRGTNFDVAASMNIASYSEDSTDIMSQLSKSAENGGSLTAQATTRGNRGYWQIEANNVEGTNLTIEYTYRVKNIGEPEFLHNNLANQFNIAEGLDAYLNTITTRISDVNAAIKDGTYKIADSYLGNAYYTGIRAGQDTEIGIYVQIEDYLANDLTFNESSTTDFIKTSDSEAKNILNIAGNETQENVKVIQTRYGKLVNVGQAADFILTLTKTLSASDTLEFPSYIAQVVSPSVNIAGSRISGTIPNNAKYVQAYADMATLDNLQMEKDEYWAETFRIVPTTGEDKQSSYILTISITSGLAIIVVGIILIRKFVIK